MSGRGRQFSTSRERVSALVPSIKEGRGDNTILEIGFESDSGEEGMCENTLSFGNINVNFGNRNGDRRD